MQAVSIKLYPSEPGLWGRRFNQWFVGERSGVHDTQAGAIAAMEMVLSDLCDEINAARNSV